MKTYSYPYLLTLISKLLGSKMTTGNNQTEELVAFTELNLTRMTRIDKTIQLSDELIEKLENLSHKQIWYLITEAWCGDSAQNLPVLNKMAEANPEKIELRIVLRDENLDFMEQYQTNGSNSIPKLVVRNEDEQDLFVWGPRPQMAQDLYNHWKAENNDRTWEQFELELHTWYARDKGLSIQKEILSLL